MITPFTWTTPLAVFLTIIIHLSEVIMTPGPNAFSHHSNLTDKIHEGCNNESAGGSVILR